MALTLLGIVLGAIVSWGITHTYYRITEKKATRENPMALLTRVSSDIDVLKRALAEQSPTDPALAAALRESLKQIDHIKYVFRAALQNWFSEFTALKVLLQDDQRPAIAAKISEMDDMMKAMSSDMKESSDHPDETQSDTRSNGG